MISKISATAVILAKNEEKVIGRTVRALQDFDQVLVVDSNSTDGTAAAAREECADVIQFVWDGKYPKKKQWSLESRHVKHDWVLFVDADEYPSVELVQSIASFIKDDSRLYGAAETRISYFFQGRQLRYGHKVVKRALCNRRKCRFPEVDDLDVATMWEVEGHYQPEVQGQVKKLRGAMFHVDLDPLYDYFGRHNRYSDWEAHLRTNAAARDQVARHRSVGGKLFDKVPLKPVLFLIYSYVLRFGFLDGREGLEYAVFHLFYQWQIGLKVRERQRVAPVRG